MGESDLDQLIAPVYKKYANPATTILAAAGDMQIHLRARCATAARGRGAAGRSRRADRAAAGRPHLFAQRRSAGSGGRRDAARSGARRLRWRRAAPAACWASASRRAGQFGLFRGRLHHLLERDEDRVAGREPGDAGRVRRGERGDRGGDGDGRAPADGLDVCAIRHGRGRSGLRRRGGAGGHGVCRDWRTRRERTWRTVSFWGTGRGCGRLRCRWRSICCGEG